MASIGTPMMTQQPPQKSVQLLGQHQGSFTPNLLEASIPSEAGKTAAWGLLVGAGYARCFGWWVASSKEAYRREMKNKGLLLAGLGGVFAASSIGLAKIRNKNDEINSAAGAAIVGLLNGLIRKSLPMALGQAALFGSMGFIFNFLGEIEAESNQYRLEDRRLHLGQHFSALPRPDPFASRIAEMQARDEQEKE
ncbi:hypothetical protein BASA50_005353 [Batrachochytrium salamandrivorans]|uniref:Complex I-B14.7 n=1 Tax=Batrachochytrium salamandrivorans TaxID=1357716 RepID=A0ABQ8FCR4_9FUNG|nr:hypothetical protein BASA62_005509 [Batrachochytrium salamandrivorans]KAH6573824.1 hypothetical protein BASA60_005844 [Batrachochytrium salamandrivorans]KAH6587899.1 hypothetical protein BASA61_006162 [Batrachochytrium salamandrivorans]KAH6596056.1 hypothetical protein BASA50_005353 [Batrachochytrium salamandrivorans]KAH9247290.1 hypothetical protein BASA81_015132 [Batrachochytrium salamandrivorans]